MSTSEYSELAPFGGTKFNDPFLLNSNLYIPENFETALEFALYLAIHNPVYTQAVKRTVSHFLTDIQFVGKTGSAQEQSDLRSYLMEEWDIMGCLRQALMEKFIYGNSFLRIHYPFKRYLVDRRDGKSVWMDVTSFGDNISYNCEKMTYTVPDPRLIHSVGIENCPTVDLEFQDRASHDASEIRLRLLDPKRMLLSMNLISGRTEYIYRFEEFFIADVKAGKKIHQINETPMEMLRAISQNKDFKFSDGTIYHFKNKFISGLSYNGWGIPNILLNYTNLHHYQVLRCINEAVGLDYMLPFRLLSPAGAGGNASADAASSINLLHWRSAVSQLIHEKRTNPTAIHTIPFPVTYQEMGASGKSLAPVELMRAQADEVREGFGIVPELWHFSLQMQQTPTAIRVFESTHSDIARDANMALKWVTKSILDYLNKEQIGVRMLRPHIADDLDNRQVALTLASGGEVSRKTAYSLFNIDDPVQENVDRMREDLDIQRERQKLQNAFDREQQLGSASQVVDAMVQAQAGPGGVAPGPAPAPAGGPAPGPMAATSAVNPLELEQQGEEIAMQWAQIPDVGERRKAMAQVKASNPTLYAVAQRKLEDMRQQGASQGRKAVTQPQG